MGDVPKFLDEVLSISARALAIAEGEGVTRAQREASKKANNHAWALGHYDEKIKPRIREVANEPYSRQAVVSVLTAPDSKNFVDYRLPDMEQWDTALLHGRAGALRDLLISEGFTLRLMLMTLKPCDTDSHTREMLFDGPSGRHELGERVRIIYLIACW